MESNYEHFHKLGMTALKIVENDKGILAADESEASIQKRFDHYGVENTSENRRKFRQLLFTTPGINKFLGGVILNEETFMQKTDDGVDMVDFLLEQGISPGIKFDKGLIDFSDTEKISVGLEDLEKRCQQGSFKRAHFAKWRSVFTITSESPTEKCINENCEVLAKYAEICQRNLIVPIVEPEILWTGTHTMDEAYLVANTVLSCLMYHLNLNSVYIPGVIVKPSFITPGKESKIEVSDREIAQITLNSLISTIPTGIPGVVFLSGGHTPKDATRYLNAINKEKARHTWKLTFSYGRALTDPVLEKWKGNPEFKYVSQLAFQNRLFDVHKAVKGMYVEEKHE